MLLHVLKICFCTWSTLTCKRCTARVHYICMRSYRVSIAKPAPPDAPLKDIDYSGAAGPRYDDVGRIIPHSILGTVDDYKTMARLDGTIPLVRMRERSSFHE